MATRMIGLEKGRKQLSQLAALAYAGQGSLLTRYGRPYAAIVAPEVLLGSRRKPAFLALRGTGRGLWEKASGRHVGGLRREWD